MNLSTFISTAILVLMTTSQALGEINLSTTVHCSYQNGQIIDKNTAENLNNSVPLNWSFNNLTTASGKYMSGGDSGEVMAIPISDGVAIYLPYSIGTHAFTIWTSGESIWNKQTNLRGLVYSQQFLGNCSN